VQEDWEEDRTWVDNDGCMSPATPIRKIGRDLMGVMVQRFFPDENAMIVGSIRRAGP